MFLSKLSNFTRAFVVSFFILTMFACSSVPTTTNENVETTKTELPEAKTPSFDNSQDPNAAANNAVSDIVFTGVDPMADIQVNDEIKKAYRQVANFSKVEKYDKALSLLDGLKAKYPQLSGPDYQKARVYFVQEQYEQALKSINLSLDNNSRNYYSLNLKGIILREQGDFESAKGVYYQAIEIYPPYPNSHLNLGVLADLYMKDLSLAVMQYKTYTKLTGDSDKTVANWILEIERRIKAGE